MLTTTVASAPFPSPLIGTLVYDVDIAPTLIPALVIVTILIEPSIAFYLTGALSGEVCHSWGTGIKSEVSNFIISFGLIV